MGGRVSGVPLWLLEEFVVGLAETIALILPEARGEIDKSLTDWICELRSITAGELAQNALLFLGLGMGFRAGPLCAEQIDYWRVSRRQSKTCGARTGPRDEKTRGRNYRLMGALMTPLGKL